MTCTMASEGRIPRDGDEAAAAEDEAILWRRWQETRDEQSRESLLARHLPFGRIIAAKMYARRTHDDIAFDDYLQFATLALLESFERYDPDLGAQFRTYAYPRMTGAILSGLEQLSERQQQIALRRRLKADRLSLAKQLAPADMGKAEKLLRYLADVGVGFALGAMLEGSTLLVNDEPWIPDRSYERVELRQLRQRLKGLLGQLTERESQVIRAHYLQEITFDDIARELGISNARVSQLHVQALQRLRRLLQESRRCDVVW